MTEDDSPSVRWLKVLEPEELPEGRVIPVTCEHRTLCMTHHDGNYGALDNRCPHQGGPLGEGSIENGLLRCPWHGWDYDPLTGRPPGDFDDGVETFEVDVREDGIYVALPEEAPHTPTVSDLMAQTMVNWGVRWVFGMVGHSNLGLADSFRMLEEKGELSYVGIRHEGAAAFACSAYGKLTGRPAACMSIAGPGATNMLTGLWDANVDRSPVLALTGQVATQVLGRGNFQEVDLQAAYGQVAQWAQPVLHSSPFAELMNLACKHALLNRGVSHLIFPDEVQQIEQPEGAEPGRPDGRVGDRAISPAKGSLARASKMLREAERPVIIVGHGARYEMDGIVALAEELGCPVITTYKGKGLISDHHPLGGGVLGRSGTPIASWFMNEADLLLVLGASFSNHTGITPKKPTIQVDYELTALGRFHAVDVPVWGEIGVTVGALREEVREKGHGSRNHVEEVAARWRLWRDEKASRAEDDRGEGIAAAALFDALNRTVPQDAILCVDVGNNAYSFGRYFEATGQSILMSGYLGSIGFALPAALGAWAATQEEDPRFRGRKVISVSGDGGFAQYMGELNTALKYGMAITHIVLNDQELGKISKEQRAGEWDVWQTALHNPPFAKYAEISGASGIAVRDPGKLDEALARAFAHDGPSLVEVHTDPKLI